MCTYRGTYAELLVEKFGYTVEEAEEKQRALLAQWEDRKRQRREGSELSELHK